MSKIKQTKRNLIFSAYETFTDSRILVLDNINGQAFETFKGILVKRNAPINEEEVVFFRDLTWFSGGEEGILITNAHFYYYQWGYRQIAISNIAKMKVGGLFDENIVFVLNCGQSISIWASKLFHEIKTIIEILKADDAISVNDQLASVQVQCLGCRAIIRSNQKYCEYCRSPL